jgi:hypothetical protein
VILRARILLPVAFSIVLLVATFSIGLVNGVASSMSDYTINRVSLGAVVSSKLLGLRGHPYSSYKAVDEKLATSLPKAMRDGAQVIHGTAGIDRALAAAASTEVCGDTTIFHAWNDQGLVDYTRASFAMFGVQIRAVYYFYFVPLALSAGLYLVAFWRSYSACALLFACMAATFLSVGAYLPATSENVWSTHYLSTLGIIPALHIALYLLRPRERLSWWEICGVIGQAAVIALSYAIRMTSAWIILGLLGILAFNLIGGPRTLRQSGLLARVCGLLFRRGAVVLVALAAILTINAVRVQFLTPSCDTSLGRHTLWDTIFIGLEFHPEWEARFGALYGHKRDDALARAAAERYAREHEGFSGPLYRSTEQTEKTTSEQMPFGSFLVFDDVLRAAFFEFLRQHPRFVLEDFLLYKPIELLRDLGRYTFLSIGEEIPAGFIAALVLMIVAVGLAGAFGPRREADRDATPEPHFAPMAAILAAFFVFSCIPIILAYPTSWLIADQGFVVLAGLCLLAIWLVESLGRKTGLGRRRPFA